MEMYVAYFLISLYEYGVLKYNQHLKLDFTLHSIYNPYIKVTGCLSVLLCVNLSVLVEGNFTLSRDIESAT